MRIDSYSFGEVVINGKKYTSDVIIFPNKVNSSWWRKEGHELNMEDIKGIIEAAPKVLIVGTGAFGYVEVKQEVKEFLKSNNIELIAEPTDKACKIYNEKSQAEEQVIAALHLTC